MDAEKQGKAFDLEVEKLEETRLKNADSTKRKQMREKRDRNKAITEEVLCLEKQVEAIRTEECRKKNAINDLQIEFENLEKKSRKFQLELDNLKPEVELYRQRQKKTQVCYTIYVYYNFKIL